MTDLDRGFIKLLLRREAGTRDKYLIALRTTADHYGWTEQFPPWTPRPVPGQDNPRLCYCPSQRGELRTQAGRKLVISRSPSTAGWPAGLCNGFKVSNNCANLDLAELAHFTKGDWHWMEGLTGQRRRRADWEAMYAAGR